MAFQQMSISTGEKQCSISSRTCSPTVGRGTLPKDLRDVVIVSLYKNKGEKSECSNYRGITLLSIAGKILARVLLNRLIPTIAQENTSESQCGLRSNRGTVGIIFVLRQIQEKCREQNMGLYPAFVDLILSAVMDCGKSWRALVVPPNFSPSSDS